MEKTVGKEGKGVKGTGFEGATGSNHYQQGPPSSNANLGIDADIAAGSSESARTPQSKGLNVGSDTSSQGEDNMSNAKFGIGPDISTGTVRGGLEGVLEKRSPGEFGLSAKGGNKTGLNEEEVYGSGARKSGTAAQFGEPGRGGSMALAIKGLSGGTGGKLGEAAQPAMGAQKDLAKAEKGMQGSGGVGNNPES